MFMFMFRTMSEDEQVYQSISFNFFLPARGGFLDFLPTRGGFLDFLPARGGFLDFLRRNISV